MGIESKELYCKSPLEGFFASKGVNLRARRKVPIRGITGGKFRVRRLKYSQI